MARIRGRDTRPELVVRRLLHGLGYRYRLHSSDLPGKPDIVFGGRRKVVFVHGCFWHHHQCKIGHVPKTRSDFWIAKFARNIQRDERNLLDLKRQGWDALVLWECEVHDRDTIRKRLVAFLGEPAARGK